MQKKIKLIIAAALFLYASCTENPPAISQLFWQINKFYDIEKDFVYEKLSFFVQVQDEDGIDDLRTVYIINDKNELFWILDRDSWILKTNQDENWIGTNNLFMNDFSTFPAGSYRIVIIDDAGKRDEQSFNISLNNFNPPASAFPSAVSSSSSVSVSADAEAVWFYDNNDILLEEKYPDDRSGNIAAMPENTGKIYIYRLDRANGFGLIAGPYRP